MGTVRRSIGTASGKAVSGVAADAEDPRLAVLDAAADRVQQRTLWLTLDEVCERLGLDGQRILVRADEAVRAREGGGHVQPIARPMTDT